MPKVSQAHRDSRRDQNLDAARERFAAQGIQATTMADIIDAAGLSAGAIYGYFASKQELAVAVARRTIEGRVAELLEASSAQPLSPSGILRVMSTGFDRDEIEPGLVVQLWGAAAGDPEFLTVVRAAFADMGSTFADHLVRWAVAAHGLDPAAATEWADRTLPVMLACGQGLILQRAILPDFDRERYLAAVAAVLD